MIGVDQTTQVPEGRRAVRVLLVFPVTSKNFTAGATKLTRRINMTAVYPPQGLLTVAAYLPSWWEIKLIDMNVEKLTDKDLAWAECVFLSAIIGQLDSLRAVAARAKSIGKHVVVGGSVMNTSYKSFVDEYGFDTIAVGECEPYIEELAADIEYYRPKKLYKVAERPDFSTLEHRPARYDLVRHLNRYLGCSIEFSRGCPYSCDFCDIIQVFGQGARYKTSEQVRAELDALYASGWREFTVISDDNILGHRGRFRELCKTVADWQKEHGYPFELWVQCSINIADNEEDQKALLAANFKYLFIGVESVSVQVLESVGKKVNIKGNTEEQIDRLIKAGFDIMTGIIVGFDNDRDTVFDDVIRFINTTKVPVAYVQILQGLEGTPLIDRLREEGRIGIGLGQYAIGTGRTNIKTVMDPRKVQEGYAKILESLYDWRASYKRARDFILELGPSNIDFKPRKYTRMSLFSMGRMFMLLSYLPYKLKLISLLLGLLFRKERWRFWRYLEYVGMMHVFVEFYRERLGMIKDAPITEFEMAEHASCMKDKKV